MTKKDMSETHKNLTEVVKKYISIIINECGSYMPPEVLSKLKNITDYNQIIRIYDYGEINAYANSDNIMLPLCASKIFNILVKIPFYGINKNHKLYNEGNMIVNKNSFMTYVNHIFVSGSELEDYYEDLLLHETMHFCGSDGSSVIKEGINELLTRMIAQKYGLRTSACGYPKEVKLCYKLMSIFGEDTIKQLAFIHNFQEEVELIERNNGVEAATLYMQVTSLAEKEFQEKYYSYMSSFKGPVGVIKKIYFYQLINYDSIYSLIDEYQDKLDINKKCR